MSEHRTANKEVPSTTLPHDDALVVGSGDTYEGWCFAQPADGIDDYAWPPTPSHPIPSYPTTPIR